MAELPSATVGVGSAANDDLVFAEEGGAAPDNGPVPVDAEPWTLLVVDDEPAVHDVTRLALADFAFDGRGLRIVSAHSLAEAEAALAEHPETAVILLDVVMETDDAGLAFVRHVRTVAKNHLTRIILRTGQPGQAPERRVILEYDINDYKHKGELTAQRLFTAVVSGLRGYRDLRFISRFNQALGRFVPPELTQLLGRRSIVDVALGDYVEGNMGVLFSDMRAFTTRSERLSPTETFRFLNGYLQEIGPIIRAHHGYVDKYVGDAILAIFPTGADDALQAAIGIQARVDDFNAVSVVLPQDRVRVGIGVHAGPLVLGVIGEQERMEGTVIADCVNLTSRLEGICKEFGVRIVTTEECLASTSDASRYATRPLGQVPLRGLSRRVAVHEVFDCDGEDLRNRKLATAAALGTGIERLVESDLEAAILHFRAVVERLPDDPVALDYLAQATLARRAALLGEG